MTQQITWSTPSGSTLDISLRAQSALEARGEWPRDGRGEEYCTVSRGQHWGMPDVDLVGGRIVRTDPIED